MEKAKLGLTSWTQTQGFTQGGTYLDLKVLSSLPTFPPLGSRPCQRRSGTARIVAAPGGLPGLVAAGFPRIIPKKDFKLLDCLLR